MIPELFDRPCPCGGPREAPQKRGRGRPPKRVSCEACLSTGHLPWHPLTMAWWRDVWTSEVCAQYLHVDLHGLWRLAVLVDRYWRDSSAGLGVRELAAEIRLQQQSYGITPLDRARLQWKVEQEKAPADAAPAEEQAPVSDEERERMGRVLMFGGQ